MARAAIQAGRSVLDVLQAIHAEVTVIIFDLPFKMVVFLLSHLTVLPCGGQVAACVCLFALDKAEAIPVDTHVWQLATRFYAPKLKGEG